MEEFTCDECGGTFEVGDMTEEEKQEELASNFPGASVEDCGRVCDDCYEKILRRLKG